MRLEDAQLYLVLQPDTLTREGLDAFCRAAIQGGVDILQARLHAGEDDGAPPPLPGKGEVVSRLHAICDEEDALLVLAGPTAHTAVAQANGIHLDAPDASFGLARAALAPEQIAGVTAHSPDEARLAGEVGADYILYAGDPTPGVFAGLPELTGTTIFMAGVANADDARELVENGVVRFCLDSGAVKDAEDVRAFATAFSRALGRSI